MATIIITHSNGVTNKYTAINNEYTSLVVSSDKYDQITVIVDSRLVQELSKFSWFKHCSRMKVGTYITSSINTDEQRKLADRFTILQGVNRTLLLHRYIACLAHLPHPEGADLVDHISRTVLDNRVKNLRWATQSLQNVNQGKSSSKTTARKAEGVPYPLPKHVNFRPDEPYGDKKDGKTRSFFRIEKRHPALVGKTSWSSGKAKGVSDLDKYKETMKKLAELDAMINPDPEENLRAQLNLEFNELMAIDTLKDS